MQLGVKININYLLLYYLQCSVNLKLNKYIGGRRESFFAVILLGSQDVVFLVIALTGSRVNIGVFTSNSLSLPEKYTLIGFFLLKQSY